MERREETPERLARPLIRLAKAAGVETSYIGQQGEYIEIDDDVLVDVLTSLGVEATTPEAVEQSLLQIVKQKYSRFVAPTVLHIQGDSTRVVLYHGVLDVPQVTLTLDDGSLWDKPLESGPGDGHPARLIDGNYIVTSSVLLPADLPLGYHTLSVTIAQRTMQATVISAPKRVELIDGLAGDGKRMWGWMAQFYSIRSATSWGIGDYLDLGLLLEGAQSTGADFVLINPVHAGEPCAPLTPSPYLPVSRRFVNFTYINPESIEEYSTLDDNTRAHIDELRRSVQPLNLHADQLDRDAMWNAKMPALWALFKAGRSEARQQAFDAFKQREGEDLEGYATWCLAYDKWGAPTDSPDSWIHTTDKHHGSIQELRNKYPDTLDFYRWLEWVATEQLRDAHMRGLQTGMRIGLMSDMAVGVHPLGSDVWWNPERFAQGATVGAPPDYFNQQGQNWSQPPLNPRYLEQTGYKAYRDLVAGMFHHSGAVRIDHAIGLFRLWWIPQGRSAKQGAYVHNDADIMLAILALEAYRAHGVIVGEDLGVVPKYMAQALRNHGLMGCAVEWFEQDNGAFIEPDQWPELALASVNTHDIPPAAGYLQYVHVTLRHELGLLTGSYDDFMRSAHFEHNALLSMLTDLGCIKREWLEDERAHEQDIVEGLHKALLLAPSKLYAASITDAVGETRAQNQPGTNNEYPNWRIPLCDGNGTVMSLDTLFDQQRLQSLAAIMRGEDSTHAVASTDVAAPAV